MRRWCRTTCVSVAETRFHFNVNIKIFCHRDDAIAIIQNLLLARLRESRHDGQRPEKLTAFAPAERPRIAIAIVVENRGSGGANAAPLVRKALDYYLPGIRPEAAGQAR